MARSTTASHHFIPPNTHTDTDTGTNTHFAAGYFLVNILVLAYSCSIVKAVVTKVRL